MAYNITLDLALLLMPEASERAEAQTIPDSWAMFEQLRDHCESVGRLMSKAQLDELGDQALAKWLWTWWKFARTREARGEDRQSEEYAWIGSLYLVNRRSEGFALPVDPWADRRTRYEE